jgi:hypothetical protein
MKNITLQTAKTIAADWHGGQWSALYAFASSGEITAAQEPLCLAEIEENLNNNSTGAEQVKRLQLLKLFLKSHYPAD